MQHASGAGVAGMEWGAQPLSILLQVGDEGHNGYGRWEGRGFEIE